MSTDYDLLVIGSGPAGQKAAIQAAKLGRRVALVERHELGGVSVNWGTIPSKTLRETIVYLTGLSQRETYGQSYRVKDDITIDDLRRRTKGVIEREVDVVRDQLLRNHVHVVHGNARFVDPHTVHLSGGDESRLSAENIVIATGTRPAHPPDVEFDDRTILDSDGLLLLDRIPSSAVVVGAGVVGIEYASMFAALGAKVTVVERRAQLLDFCDAQIAEGLQYHLRELGVVFRFGEEVTAVEHTHERRADAARQRQADRHPRSFCTPPVARVRPRTSGSSRRVCRPTNAAGSPSAPTIGQRSTTSSPRATWSAGRRSQPRRWSRAAWRPHMHSDTTLR